MLVSLVSIVGFLLILLVLKIARSVLARGRPICARSAGVGSWVMPAAWPAEKRSFQDCDQVQSSASAELVMMDADDFVTVRSSAAATVSGHQASESFA